MLNYFAVEKFFRDRYTHTVQASGCASESIELDRKATRSFAGQRKIGAKTADKHKTSPTAKSETLSEAVTTTAAAAAADDDDSTTLVAPTEPSEHFEPPSIGLSTPITYYTPLKDLGCFLNRSSQFHSSTAPDVIALVTSATTTPKKAEKGPRHWNTTLHITDLSCFPKSTVVQVFRPYASALPVAQKGDVVLLRCFGVKSLNRQASLVSGEESAWCVWRYGVPLWGKKRGLFGECKSREEVKGPAVERGEGEWREVEKLRAWFKGQVEAELEENEKSGVKTRSKNQSQG